MGFPKEMGMVPELSLFLRQIYCIIKIQQPFWCFHMIEKERVKDCGETGKSLRGSY